MTEALRSGEVDYTLDDLRALASLISPGLWRLSSILGWVLLVASLLVFALSRLIGTPYAISDFLLALGAGALLVGLGNRTVRASMWRWRLGRDRLYAPQSFVIGESAFQISSSTGELKLPWTSILSIKLAGERLFLFITKYSAYIVPRRAFDSREEFAKFAAAAEQYWKSKHAL